VQSESELSLEGTDASQIALKMTFSLNLSDALTGILQGLVDEIDATFARIWLVGDRDMRHLQNANLIEY
jgi:hypothetical protein